MLRPILLVAGLISLVTSAVAQENTNPLVQILHAQSKQGISPTKTHDQNPINFKRSSARKGVDVFLKELFESEEEGKAYREAIIEVIAEMEKELDQDKLGTDPTIAFGIAVSSLHTMATGEDVTEDTMGIIISQGRAIFNVDKAKRASDAQKQEFFEYAISHMALPLLLLAQAKTEEEQQQIVALAGGLLSTLLGTDPSNISLSASGLTVKGTGAPVAETTKPAPAGGVAPGFSIASQPGFAQEGNWVVHRIVEGDDLNMAMYRLLPAIPAQGNMGDALRKLWTESVPPELKDKASGLVFRRYVGDKLLAQFIFGMGKESHREADAIFTLYLIDCGPYWQPIVIAQTYEQTGSIRVGEAFSAQFQYKKSAVVIENLLAAMRCPGQSRTAIVDDAAIVGNYSFGSGSNLQWVNVYTGATSMTFVSYSGELNLKADKTFTYTYSGASGVAGAAQFAGAKGSGTWKIEGDLLYVNFNSYSETTGNAGARQYIYKIACVSVFPDGEKIAILMNDEQFAANPHNVLANSGDLFTTKKKQG
ncbi:hypothetical protein QPK87_10735 [Kamptonema cortianum]|nr:hypothetical protein [Geitlerinema splendidum]MDK3157049.1 hypothetical protein [Kamptonema cortianum]